MKFKNRLIGAAAAAPLAIAAGLYAPTASAVFQVNGWTFDIGAAMDGPAATGKLLDVEELTFTAPFHSVTYDTNMNGMPDIGEFLSVDTLGTVTNTTTSTGLNVVTTTGKVLSSDFEITFRAVVDAVVYDVDMADVNQAALAGTLDATPGVPSLLLGLAGPHRGLEIYVDDIITTPSKSNPATGDISDGVPGGGNNFENGTLVAKFNALAVGGGAFNTATLDGVDDRFFELAWAKPGVILDATGVYCGAVDCDLGAWVAGGGQVNVLLAQTNDNTDSDPDNDGMLDTIFDAAGSPFNRTTGLPVNRCLTSITNSCGIADGSADLAGAVPAPSVLALMGLGLAGLGATSGRRKGKA